MGELARARIRFHDHVSCEETDDKTTRWCECAAAAVAKMSVGFAIPKRNALLMKKTKKKEGPSWRGLDAARWRRPACLA